MQDFGSLNHIQGNLKAAIKQNIYIAHTPDWFEEKMKYEFTIWDMARGNAYITVDGKTFTASAGDAVLFSPGISHSAHTDGDGCEFLFQQFSLEQGNAINILNDINLSGIVKGRWIGPDCLAYCESMKNVHLGPYGLSLWQYTAFLSYLAKVLWIVREGKNIPFFEKTESSPRTNLRRAMSYIGEHFLEDLSIKEIAEKAGFSEKYFMHQFRMQLGIPPKQYMIQCRMRCAVHMLIHTEEKIKDIALHLGYADVYSFSKAFKKFYDYSPSDFRKLYRY